jgi:hypothetical protein
MAFSTWKPMRPPRVSGTSRSGMLSRALPFDGHDVPVVDDTRSGALRAVRGHHRQQWRSLQKKMTPPGHSAAMPATSGSAALSTA